jgi:hypothetical protein
VTLTAQVSITGGAMITVNEAVHVTGLWQELVTVKVTVVEPPVLGGAPVLLFESVALHPPVKFAVASQVANFASIAACDCPGASVTFTGQVSTTGELNTVNVAEQVFGGSHELVTVNVTVTVPPQAGGAPLLLLEIAALQPPLNVAVFNQVVNFESI